jgi:hypothetical protein
MTKDEIVEMLIREAIVETFEANALAAILPQCFLCGCDELNACDEGCSWSERYTCSAFPIPVCSRCESTMLSFEINATALSLLTVDRRFLLKPEGFSLSERI